jgi:predicted Ser/Thr protein kinase
LPWIKYIIDNHYLPTLKTFTVIKIFFSLFDDQSIAHMIEKDSNKHEKHILLGYTSI